MIKLKKTIKKFLHLAGYDVAKLDPSKNAAFQLLKGLECFDVDLVLDIGANEGQFALELRTVGYGGKIVSFEPLSVAHKVLLARSKNDRQWIVHKRGAVGDRDGQASINISGNSVSSSILNMTEAHSSAAQGSAYIGQESTPIFKLDTIASSVISADDRYFLKIDTQGFEWEVMEGAKEALLAAQGVLCELSLVPLYDGQKLWLDILHHLEAQGLTLWSIQTGFADPRDGRTLQLDAIFFRQ